MVLNYLDSLSFLSSITKVTLIFSYFYKLESISYIMFCDINFDTMGSK